MSTSSDPYPAPGSAAGPPRGQVYGAAPGRAAVPGQGAGAGPGRISGRAVVPPAPPDQPVESRPGRSRPPGPPGGRPPARVGRPRRRWRRILVGTALTLVLLSLVLLTGGYFYARGLESNMAREEVFSRITGERPAPAADGTLNLLLLGTDSRAPEADSGDNGRTDTMILMHIPSSQDRAYLVSLPRDLWVYIPPSPDGSAGGYEAKINAATVFGGLPLAVMTVEGYTGVRIDHVVQIDFSGLVEVTDALGGVEMDIEQTIESIHGDHRVFEEGRQQLNGEEALDYIRQRYQFPDGDFARMRHQQQFLRALMDKAASGGTLSNPGKLNAFLQTATETLTVDEEFSLIDVAWDFRHLRGDNLTFLTTPHNGTGTIEGQSVVLSDDEAAAQLYGAVREDRMAGWVADNPDAVRSD